MRIELEEVCLLQRALMGKDSVAGRIRPDNPNIGPVEIWLEDNMIYIKPASGVVYEIHISNIGLMVRKGGEPEVDVKDKFAYYCDKCSKPFERTHSRQRYCSNCKPASKKKKGR